MSYFPSFGKVGLRPVNRELTQSWGRTSWNGRACPRLIPRGDGHSQAPNEEVWNQQLDSWAAWEKYCEISEGKDG